MKQRLNLSTLLIFLLAGCGGGGGSAPANGGGSSQPTTPTISVDGASVSSGSITIEVTEGETAVAGITTSAGSLTIDSNSTDASQFTLSGGELTFSSAPDFENPTDSNQDNSYSLSIRATNGAASSSVSVTVNISNLFEMTGRIVDGPVAEAQLFADLNCDNALSEGEPTVASNDEGFYQLAPFGQDKIEDGCEAKLLSVGGKDVATGILRSNLVLATALSDLAGESAVLTPISTLLASVEDSEEETQLLSALRLPTSKGDITGLDPWLASQDEDLDSATRGQAIQRINLQIASILDIVISLTVEDSSASQLLTAASAAVAQSVSGTLVNALKQTSQRVSLSDTSLLTDMLSEAIIQAEIAIEGQQSGANFDRAQAELEAEAKETLLTLVIAELASATAFANEILSDQSVNPTSELAIATAKAAQSAIIPEALSVAEQLNTLQESNASSSEITERLKEAALAISSLLAPSALLDLIEANGGSLGELDSDKDGVVNPIDPDDDNDGVADALDDFPLDPAASVDTDGDGAPDDWNEGKGASDSTSVPALELDEDDDNDGELDGDDNCPLISNSDQSDLDQDGEGDACDTSDDRGDSDGDGWFDMDDNCPSLRNADQLDTDSDNTGDACDTDDDGDGIADADDVAPLNKDIGADGFSVARIAFEDHIDGRSTANLYGLQIQPEESTLRTSLDAGLVDKSNLNDVIANLATEGASPKVILFLDKLPGAGRSGEFSVGLTLLDGTDASRDGQERQLEAGLSLTWESSDSGLSIVAPSQTLTIRFTEGGTSLVAEVEDVEPRAISIKPRVLDRYKAVLEFDLISLFTQELPSNIPIEDYFDITDDYHIAVAIEQGDQAQFFYGGSPFDSISMGATIVDVPLPEPSGDSWNIAKPSEADFPGLSDLPTTSDDGVIDLPDEPIALSFSAENTTNAFVSGVPILYGRTALVEPKNLSVKQMASLDDAMSEQISGSLTNIPSLTLLLDRLPSSSGSTTINIQLSEGKDLIKDEGELVVGAAIGLAWTATNEGFNVKADGLTLYALGTGECSTSGTERVDITNIPENCKTVVSNFNPEIAQLRASQPDLPPRLDLKLINLMFDPAELEGAQVTKHSISSLKNFYLAAEISGDGNEWMLEGMPLDKIGLLLVH